MTITTATEIGDIGVYAIRRVVDGKCYVGSSARSIRARWRRHTSMLMSNRHHATYLQHSWNKYGQAAHEFVVLERCDGKFCIEREQVFIDTIDSSFNVCRIAGSRLGSPQPRAAVEKVRLSNIGRRHSVEAKARLSAWQKGVPKPYNRPAHNETLRREKIRAALVGRVISDETRARISVAAKTRKLSPEGRVKLSAARRASGAIANVR